MLARYTKSAREVVPAAYREAAALGADVVGPEHLLLALSRIEGAARVLAEVGVRREELQEALEAEDTAALAHIGISLHDVREHLEASFGENVWDRRPPVPRKLGFAGSTKKILQLAAREAASLGHRRVRPEHVLLAATCRNGRARALLEALDVSPDDVRERARAELVARNGSPAEDSPARFARHRDFLRKCYRRTFESGGEQSPPPRR